MVFTEKKAERLTWDAFPFPANSPRPPRTLAGLPLPRVPSKHWLAEFSHSGLTSTLPKDKQSYYSNELARLLTAASGEGNYPTLCPQPLLSFLIKGGFGAALCFDWK